MEYKDVNRPSFNGHSTGQPESQKHAAVPATLLPAVLSHLGLADRPLAKGDQAATALQDEKSPVRVAAVRSLGERREVPSVPLLVSALHDPAWEVRAAAVWALGAFGQHAPVLALREALADKDGSVRAAALRVLSSMRGQVPLESLARMRHDDDWQVREAAAVTEEELGEQAPPGPLVARLRDENEAQGEAAQIPPKPSHPEVLPLAFPSLPLTVQRAMQSEVLEERYQQQGSIGRGGMATIYRGWDMRMDRAVAIKVLRELYTTDPKFVRRFQVEAKAASALQHPNIVQVYDYGQSEGNYFIIMELVEGTDLRRYLRSRGILDVDRALIIAHDVALGLGAAHRRNIVHRDVKPQNILVGRSGSIKLTDFGIASVYKDINTERLTTTGMTLGTVQYYAPEQAQGEIVSPAADVYALGIVMYEMLTGRTPFDGDTPVAVAMQHIQDAPMPPSQYNPSIPAALEEIILRCLEKVPEMRFRDGSQLARALEALGEAELNEGAAGAATLTPGQIAPRPANSGGRTIPQRPTSSSNGMLNGAAASKQPTYMSPPVVPPQAIPQRPFQRSTVARSGALQKGNRRSRLATVITVLIILATIIVLLFSIYLASEQLHLFNLPFGGGGAIPPATTPATASVPKLIGLSYGDANDKATQAGFKLCPNNNDTSGVVINQKPDAGNPYTLGDCIDVTMGPPPSSSPTPLPTFGPSPTST
jgi:eukaryotic-like serine/threonine-protein kinase